MCRGGGAVRGGWGVVSSLGGWEVVGVDVVQGQAPQPKQQQQQQHQQQQHQQQQHQQQQHHTRRCRRRAYCVTVTQLNVFVQRHFQFRNSVQLRASAAQRRSRATGTGQDP